MAANVIIPRAQRAALGSLRQIFRGRARFGQTAASASGTPERYVRPSRNGGVCEVNAALAHHGNQIAIDQAEAPIPPDKQTRDLSVKMPNLEQLLDEYKSWRPRSWSTPASVCTRALPVSCLSRPANPHRRTPGHVAVFLLDANVLSIFTRRRMRIHISKTGRALSGGRGFPGISFVMNHVYAPDGAGADNIHLQLVIPRRRNLVASEVFASIRLQPKIENDVVGRAVGVAFTHGIHQIVATGACSQNARVLLPTRSR
jgi:hypothetical protein